VDFWELENSLMKMNSVSILLLKENDGKCGFVINTIKLENGFITHAFSERSTN